MSSSASQSQSQSLNTCQKASLFSCHFRTKWLFKSSAVEFEKHYFYWYIKSVINLQRFWFRVFKSTGRWHGSKNINQYLCHNSNEKDADRLSDKRTTFSSTFQKSERWAFPAGDPTSTCLLPPHTISILNLWFHSRVILRWAHRKNVLIALRLLPKSPVPTLFRPGFHLSSDRGWWASK